MRFLAQALNPVTEAVTELTLEAPSRSSASAQVAEQGLVVLSIASLGAEPAERARKPASDAALDVSWWCQELRTLLNAGMTVVEALETLNAQTLGKARADVHNGLIERLRRGETLSSAMSAAGAFPPILIAGVKASERTSTLSSALDEYVTYHKMVEKLRKQVVSAAIYPSLVGSLGAAITCFLLLFVIPRFSSMYAELRGSLGLATQLLVGASKLLTQHGGLVAAVLCAALVAAVYAFRSGLLTRGAMAVAERIPLLQRQLEEFKRAKLYQSLSLMVRGGYALDDALLQCASLELGGDMRDRVLEANAALALGRRVSDAFSGARLTDVVTKRLLTVGERTGDFDRILQTVAERHASTFATFIERATRIVEPAMLLLVSGAVGCIIVLMYMPIFDIAASVH